MENEHLWKNMKRQEEKSRKLMQDSKKNESEILWKTLDTWTKEWDMYKAELEKYRLDNQRVWHEMKQKMEEIEMLWWQVFTLEN